MAVRASRRVGTPSSSGLSHYDIKSFSQNQAEVRGSTPSAVLGPTVEVQEAYEGPSHHT
jgi:hypothetical protein